MSRILSRLYLLLAASLLCGPAWTDDEDDAPAAAATHTAPPELTRAQQQAVGITVVHPLKASAAERIDAYGEVLDVAALIGDAGHLASTRAAERAASTEAQRLSLLYKGGADASLRAVENAQAAEIEAQTQAQIASSAFALQWGPLARVSGQQRAALIDALSSGRAALLRADLPGRVRLGTVPQTATVSVDGAPIAARVLGPLPRSAADSQSVGLLLQIDHPPSGLGAGARLLVSLRGGASSGVMVPNAALLYGEKGVYVYRQLENPGKDAKLQYAPVPVKLLQAAGDAWLVQGVDDDDLIVANGAGVLWSLQGLGTFSAEEQDHD
jgi:hypothetical protein